MTRRVQALMILMLLVGTAAVAAEAKAEAPPPPPPPPPQGLAETKQVDVSVKVIEFQTTRGMETGLSAYFMNRNLRRGIGYVSSGGHVNVADLTFPTEETAAITVFLDQMHIGETDLELSLQALVSQGRAFILSQPRVKVTVESAVPTTIKTVERKPYVNNVVVGSTSVQTTDFRETGVTLTVQAPAIVDDDGDYMTTDDTYIQLLVSAAVNEETRRVEIGLNEGAGGQIFGDDKKIYVPELASRSIATAVWVRHGQVLVLGGLYRNTKGKDLSTLPWLTQGEDAVIGLADRFLPISDMVGTPVSSSFGQRSSEEGRRELVFMIKAKVWKPAYTVGAFGGDDFPEEERLMPSLTGVVKELTEIPQGLVEGIAEDALDLDLKGEGIRAELGGAEE